MIWNTIVKWGGSKITASVIAAPIIGIFLFVAFFKMSELSLLPFLAKIWRNKFLDTTKKFQANTTTKTNPTDIMIKASKTTYENIQSQEKKTLSLDEINKNPLSSDDLLS